MGASAGCAPSGLAAGRAGGRAADTTRLTAGALAVLGRGAQEGSMPSAPLRCLSAASPLPLRSARRAEGSDLAAFTQTLSSGRTRRGV